MRKLAIFVIIGVIVGSIGGVPLYTSRSVNKSLNQIQQGIHISGFAPINQLENPSRWIYRISIQVENPTSYLINIEFSNLRAFIDEFSLGILTGMKSMISIAPEASVVSEGYITIFATTITELRSRNVVTLVLEGDITISTSFLWVDETTTQTLDNVRERMQFSEFATNNISYNMKVVSW